MNNQDNKQYRINDNNINSLKNRNFRHIGDGIYIHDFPCYKWNGFITIIGRFTAYDSNNDIAIDVYQEDGHPYSPYYQNETSSVISIIKSNIKKECKKCGITITKNGE